VLSFVGLVLISAASASVSAQDSSGRKELRRVDFSGAPGMEVVLSISELKPGDEFASHFHHGVETGYVLEGGMVEVLGKPAFYTVYEVAEWIADKLVYDQLIR
jgi:quercetin dioxygenase-like cupin family protein